MRISGWNTECDKFLTVGLSNFVFLSMVCRLNTKELHRIPMNIQVSTAATLGGGINYEATICENMGTEQSNK